jgi:type I pantothenate kinase
VLAERGIMNKKGFPESYDTRRLIEFLREVKSGAEVSAPVYSHVVYDIVPTATRSWCASPTSSSSRGSTCCRWAGPNEFVSDYFDFSIYIDADEAHIEEWYVQRFLKLCETVFQDPNSFFQNYAHLSHDEAVATARGIWREINGKNLQENIAPTRSRAGLVVRKGADHRVSDVALRRL